jgi:hypothetical protein
MSPTRRQLKGLIAEIRREDIFLDQAGRAILRRWEDDDHALNALKDILAHAEKANGPINAFDIDAFIQFVLRIKSYAEIADRHARAVKLHREIKRTLPKERTLLTRAFGNRRISPMDFIKRTGELDRIERVSPSQPPVRSSKGGSRVRTLFMRELSGAVHEDGGVRWLDDQVAAITSMVLECEIEPEQVRNARRGS